MQRYETVHEDDRADVPVRAFVRKDSPAEPYTLEIGRMRLSMSEATLIAVSSACEELVGAAGSAR